MHLIAFGQLDTLIVVQGTKQAYIFCNVLGVEDEQRINAFLIDFGVELTV